MAIPAEKVSQVSELQRAAESALDRIKHESQFPLVREDGEFVLICCWTDTGTLVQEYDIRKTELAKPDRIGFWIRQLAPKTWVTTRHLELLGSYVYRLNGGRD